MAPETATAAGTAIVTGAADGFGKVVATALHAAGYRVLVTDIDGAGAAGVAEMLDASGASAKGMALDVSRPADFEAALGFAVETWGSVEVLVNNAALTKAGPVLDIAPDDFNAIMAVNAGGTFTGCQVLGRYFKEAGYGRIVNMASLAGQNGGTATGAHYAASKGAILTLTKVFARDLAAFGITVNAIAPGPMDTPMVHRTVPAEKLPGLVANIPVGSLGDPAFVADIVVLLASPKAAFVTGATWDANGGLFMR